VTTWVTWEPRLRGDLPPSGCAHAVKGQQTACGLRAPEPTAVTIEHDPYARRCRRCERALGLLPAL
jgi:hypothetical protein